MKTSTFAIIVALTAAVGILGACKTTSASSAAASVTSTINSIADTLASDSTTQAVAGTAATLENAGVIDPQTAAEIVVADAVISQVSSAAASATASGTNGKALSGLRGARLQTVRRAEFVRILTAHKATIQPARFVGNLGK